MNVNITKQKSPVGIEMHTHIVYLFHDVYDAPNAINVDSDCRGSGNKNGINFFCNFSIPLTLTFRWHSSYNCTWIEIFFLISL